MLAGPLLARSQRYFSQASVSEYVEDSEPEREQRRSQEKARRKKKRPEVVIPPAEVIELTDSEASYHAEVPPPTSPKSQKKPIAVIYISDSSDAPLPQATAQSPGEPEKDLLAEDDPQAAVIPEVEDATTDDSLPSAGHMFSYLRGAPPGTAPQTTDMNRMHVSHALGKLPSIQVQQPLSPLKTADGSSDEEDGALKLKRFAYAAPNTIRRTVSKTPSPVEGGSVPPEPRIAGKAKRAASHRFADDFPDAQLARILKCVSCDLAWTARKTVAQKMKHIQACAKKKGLSDDTVRTLLHEQLDSLPPVASSSSSKSATPAPPSEAAAPETLLGEVLKDTQKKKPGRRPQVLQTVKSVTDTRGSILDRARTLLQTDGPSRASSSNHQHAGEIRSSGHAELPPATQMFSRSAFAAPDHPHQHAADTTQAFGRSRLAGPSSHLQGAIVRAGAEIAAQSDVSPLTQAPSGSIGTIDTHSDDADHPPRSTQVFARSKLTNVRGVAQRRVTATDALDDPISIHDASEDDFARPSSPPKPSDPCASPSPHANENSPTRSTRLTTSPRAGAAAHRTPSPNPRRSPSPPGDGFASAVPEGAPAGPADSYDYPEHWDEWIQDVWDENDGACMHYVPEPNDADFGVAGPSGLHARDKAPTPPLSPLQRRLATIMEGAPGPSSSTVDAAEPAPPAKKRGRRKKAAVEGGDAEGAEGKAADVSQDELNAKMKAAILEDAALHLRILRYEPIHFDVFMQMAVTLGMPAKRSGLKLKVRAFLDQKAIHFYGADQSKSRTKRTRHP